MIHLQNQMRISAKPETIKWIRDIIDFQVINNIPDDNTYDLRIYDDIHRMHEDIKEKAKNTEHGLSRMIATFDWKFVKNKKPKKGDYWMVREKDWELPWNLQKKTGKRTNKIKNRSLSWAEQEHTIEEVGSTFTIQGFDLNYAGVIIGPSVKYRNGKIIFDEQASENKSIKNRRTFQDGRKVGLGKQLLQNELNVLLTRGVNGLYIYAVDPALRKVLIQAEKGRIYGKFNQDISR
ncbi:DNA/RNA helicase domain-containing protein [Ignavigranum ruoffiae]|uniref:DNA/RNA helicase domain-containing protein n=1 Tax=Ignavigranum ruoffiae TaxID=89093 RepID=UPI0031F81565